MKINIKLILTVVLATFLIGCAHLPDATIRYYLAKSEVNFKVVRAVTCDAQNNLIVVDSNTPTVTHLADRKKAETIRLAGLKGKFSDTDVKFEFYEDGRLKGINSSSTGQGEKLFETALKIATAAIAIPKMAPGVAPPLLETPCAYIKKTGNGKPLIITYEGKVDLDKEADIAQEIKPDITSSSYAKNLERSIGRVYAVVESKEAPKKAPVTYSVQNGGVLLKARQPGLVKIKVKVVGFKDGDYTLWEGKLPVAQFGIEYCIPIPAPASFGKLVFATSFQESGALTSLQYAKSDGAVPALNVVNSSLTALQGETTSKKAENVKAEADLIAQQQRLARCIADPSNCK